MREYPPQAPPAKSAALALALAITGGTAGTAWAAPDLAPIDPISHLLAEKALVPAPTAPASAPASAASTTPLPGSTTPGLGERVRHRASDMVVTAMNFLGVPYRRGGSNEMGGFDCSGFTRHIFEMSFGLVLPRRVDEQASAPGLMPVRRDDLQPGDLVFFNTLKRTFSHVGIYIGDGKFIHSPRAGGEVRVEEMSLAYWRKRFTGARRVEPRAEAPLVPLLAGASDTAPR